MKRSLVRIGVFLLLGAIVNVAVAWGCSCGVLKPPGHRELLEHTPSAGDVEHWRECAGSGVLPTPAYCREYITGGVRALTVHEFDPLTNATKAGHMLEWTCAGWPSLSMEGGVFHDLGKRRILWHWLAWREDSPLKVMNLPLRLLWPGFAINTVFYAAILWLLFAGPLVMRRRWRIRRGLCATCAYPVGSNERCSECGALHAAARN